MTYSRQRIRRQVVIDIETTGLCASDGHKIIEIACIELLDRKPTGRIYHEYINPAKKIDPAATELHGIDNDFLSSKPSFREIYQELLLFIGDAQIVAHHAMFDISFLEEELSKHGYSSEVHRPFDNVFDTLLLARSIFPGQRNDLDNLCKRLNINTKNTEHSGTLHDAYIVAKVYEILMRNEGEDTDYDEKYILNLSGKEIFAETFGEYLEIVENSPPNTLFRGVSNKKYPLVPSLFRHKDIVDATKQEGDLMWLFKSQSLPHLSHRPHSEMEWLTIAQHHGLPTRLLDWSLSPLVACFFSVQGDIDYDAAVFVFTPESFLREDELRVSGSQKVQAFHPSHATKRITAQSGVFTIHPDIDYGLDTTKLRKIIITKNLKEVFSERLAQLGIHHGTMFPELDGIANHLKNRFGYRYN